MKSIRQIIAETPTLSDADALAAYLAQPAEGVRTPIQTVRSWISANKLATPLRGFAASGVHAEACGFVAEFLEGLLLAESFDGTDPTIRGAAELVVPILVAANVMTDAQAGELLAFVRRVPSAATLDDVAAARRTIKIEAWRDAKLHADAAASAVIDADPDADAAAVGAAYTAELVSRRTPPAPEGGEG